MISPGRDKPPCRGDNTTGEELRLYEHNSGTGRASENRAGPPVGFRLKRRERVR